MKPTEADITEIKKEIKEMFLEEIKRRAVENLFNANIERVNKHIARIMSSLDEEMVKELPL